MPAAPRKGRFAWLALCWLSLASCSRGPAPLQLSGPAMGTTCSVLIPALPPGVSSASVETVIAGVLRDADRHLSGWNAASELVRLNASPATDWQPISPQLHAVLLGAQAVSRASGGAFDVTVGPLVRAWGFGAEAGRDPAMPAEEQLSDLLRSVGYTKLELRGATPALRKTVPELVIDLDGIAPGWAVDRIAERLETLGLRDYLVELGGEVRARGHNARQQAWRVAVESPLAGERRAQAVIELDGHGVSTSGDYREFHEIDGRRVSHIIDPRSGRPVAHALASVTVVHASAAAADAWATALMVLGPGEGMVVARRERLAALFIARGTDVGEFVDSETPEFTKLRHPTDARL